MQLRNVKTAKFIEGKTKPIYKKISSRNMYKISRSPISTNNISEIEQKETLNLQNFQNSMMTLDISFNETSRNHEDHESKALYKKYLLYKGEYNKIISDIAYIDNKLTLNNNSIEKLEKYLSTIKEQKKEKNTILIDLLSNKESLEEIYKIKLSSLISNSQMFQQRKINGHIKEKNNINDDNNSPFATIQIVENEDNLEIKIDDIKQSDKKKFIDQVINFTEDILQKKEIETRNRLSQKINIGYQRFFSEIKSSSNIEPTKIVSNFFSKISIFIANQNKSKYPQPLINTFLKEILRINSINVEIAEILKFLNKKYKEEKKETKEKICNLVNRNENLKNKKKTYEMKKNEYKQFLDENKDKIRGDGRNKISLGGLGNANKQQCMSFILDNHFQEELGFLNDADKEEIVQKTELKKEKNNENSEGLETEINNNEKVNKVKVLSVKNLHNKLNEKCNGINNINVNNLLINNNINIENNNNIINHNIEKNNNENEHENVNEKENLNESENENDNNKENKQENIIENNLENNLKTAEEEDIENKKKIIVIKDMKCIPIKQIKLTPDKSSIFRSPFRLNKTNRKKKMLFRFRSPLYNNNKSKSPSRTKTLNYSDVNKTFNNNSTYNPRYKLLTQEISESFCYFKLSDNNNHKFNPLSSKDSNPLKYNYFEGSILIDKFFNKLKILQKSDQKYIGIDLKDIVEINLSEDMEKIIKIYKIYLKKGKFRENFDVNTFISTEKEIIGIRMHQNEKIKAIECKFFIFSIIMGKRFIPKAEFIFNNYNDFNAWYNCLQSVVKINNTNQEKDKK